ncbi:MAG: FHA domain-containing protein, partial [Magnetococcales bacterium]|nr:FHA domain-containing protein [Magnetococcales bacterium]
MHKDVLVKEFILDKEIITIGRGWGNDLRLPYHSLSRIHAQVVRIHGEKYLLRDLASKNGTVINGSSVQERRLKQGDRIVLGKYT